MPAMPNTEKPNLQEWLDHLKSVIVKPDEETLIVGHSLGGLILLKYLETLPESVVLGRGIMVAGVVDKIKDLSGKDEDVIMPWFAERLNEQKIRRAVRKLYAIFSDNDKYIPLESEGFVREKLGAETLILHNRGHFSGTDDNCFDLKEILEFI